MAGNHRRRGRRRGKAYGFHGLRPASTTDSNSDSGTGGTQTSGTSSTPTSQSSTSGS
jgi:hypothetical protein